MKLSDKATLGLILFFGLFLFSYTVIRAYLLSFTWDEAFTYLEFVRHPAWIPTGMNNMSANNHLLNTWMMKICAGLFGDSEFALRLPNLFAHATYLFFSFQLVKIFNGNSLKLLAFVLLNCNPYLLDFFSAARGYGLSMGLMMAAIYFLIFFFANERKFIPALLALFTSTLALLANLTLFPFFLITALILLFFLLADLIKKRDRKQLIIQASVMLLVAIEVVRLLLPYTLKLKESGALFFGGVDNYFKDSLVSLMLSSLYEREYLTPLAIILAVLALLVVLFSLITIVRILLKKEFIKKDLFFISIFIITIACMLAAIVQHYWMDTKFPMQRTAMYLLPLFSILTVFLLSKMKEGKWINAFSFVIMGSLVLNFVSTINLRSLVNWKEEAEIRSVMEFLEKDHPPVFEGRYNVTIGTGLLFDPPINYYRVKNNMNWLNVADYGDSGELCDYYLADRLGSVKLHHVKLIHSFSDELFLYKNELRHADTILFEQKLDFENIKEEDKNSRGISTGYFHSGKYSANTDTVWQYSKGFDITIPDSILQRSITVSVNAMVFAPENNFEGRLVISFEHPDGNIYSWKAMDIHDQVNASGKWMDINYTRYADEELKGGDHLKIYLWNYGKTPICIDDMEMRIILSKNELMW